MSLQPVTCRICHKKIDRRIEVEGVDWIQPFNRRFYHKSCFKNWADRDNIELEESPAFWRQATDIYLERELKIPIDYPKYSSQWKRYMGQNKTAKGIYLALRYYYDILGNDRNKAQGGIGIISYIYIESCSYWVERLEKEKDLNERILQQARELNGREKVIIKREKEKAPFIDLNAFKEIEEMKDD